MRLDDESSSLHGQSMTNSALWVMRLHRMTLAAFSREKVSARLAYQAQTLSWLRKPFSNEQHQSPVKQAETGVCFTHNLGGPESIPEFLCGSYKVGEGSIVK